MDTNTKEITSIKKNIELRHKALPNRLRELRLCRKLDPANIKTMTGLSQAYLSQIEHGKQTPSIKTLIKLHEIYGVSVDYMTLRTDREDKYAKGLGSEHLRDARKNNNLTQFELAYLLDYGSSTPVQRQEKKGIAMTLDRLELLADYFEVPVDYLLGLTDTDKMYA